MPIVITCAQNQTLVASHFSLSVASLRGTAMGVSSETYGIGSCDVADVLTTRSNVNLSLLTSVKRVILYFGRISIERGIGDWVGKKNELIPVRYKRIFEG